jgi:hypothetical protein
LTSLSPELLKQIASSAEFAGSTPAGDPHIDVAGVSRLACLLARQIQQRAAELQTSAERRQQAELDRMLQHPEDKVTLTQITDQGFRSQIQTGLSTN